MTCVKTEPKDQRQTKVSRGNDSSSSRSNEGLGSPKVDEKSPLLSTKSRSSERTSYQKPYVQAQKSKRIRKAGYHSSAQNIERKAHRIFHSGQGYSFEESKEMATTEFRERKRLESQRKRERAKATGKKLGYYRRPGYDKREAAIGRKVTSLLGEKNEIVTYAHARESAEKWYADYQREKCAKYRRKKKLRLQGGGKNGDGSQKDTSESV